MSLPLFEPNHLGHEPIHINNDYHIDLALSLISSVSKSYSSDFILQAIETSHVNDIIHLICTQHASDISETGALFLDGEQIDTSITVLINIDDLTVNLYSSKHDDVARRQERTTLIQPLIDNAHLAKQLLPADFVLLNMEDSLQEIYFQALAILKYMKANNNSVSLSTYFHMNCTRKMMNDRKKTLKIDATLYAIIIIYQQIDFLFRCTVKKVSVLSVIRHQQPAWLVVIPMTRIVEQQVTQSRTCLLNH